MKKYIYILLLIFLSSSAQAHTSDYKNIIKIEMEVFRNNEAIGYSNYFFDHQDNIMTVKNYTQFKVKLFGATIFSISSEAIEKYQDNKKIISSETSKKINTILRKVVTEKEGTASLANIYGYDVGGKTGTSQKYGDKNENLNTFISVFPSQDPKYVLLVMLENPQVAKNLIYNYRGMKIKGTRNEAGWNSVYVAGKIIKKIGPILAINNKEFYNKHVAKKLN